LLAVGSNYQTALIAPTEILARQHDQSIRNYLKDSRVKIELLTGSTPKPEREKLLASLASGETHIIVGTHALLEPAVRFNKLGLIVIDEQHKFGVRQREQLAIKGNRPHRLAMSATPIPRTLSLTLYGDLDISIIDEMPPGRTPVKTSWIPESAREKTFAAIHEKLKQGQQAYLIYPLVKPNPELELKSASELHAALKSRFADIGVALVHGQLSADDKDAAMARFTRGQAKLLVATVVVEVGVDVPAANIMVIEHAERFGLAQLHQLRGRIGRGSEQSFLYLFAEPATDTARERLEILCRTTDGFEIAEADMRLRGYGDFIGTRQAGMPKLKIGDPVTDLKILARARKEAFARIESCDREALKEALTLEFGKAFRLVDA
ncbi:MAG: DEAD/DEAH box helicase, partial [Planctomycetes bacterium]|nr:DEAD/DEAH box helicase [Planctomycetota bacterium]